MQRMNTANRDVVSAELVPRSTLQTPAIDPRHLSCSAFYFLVHVRRTSNPVTTTAIPHTDEPDFVDAIRQRGIQQPQIAALEGIHPCGRWTELVWRRANSGCERGFGHQISISPGFAATDHRPLDKLWLIERL